MQQECCPGRAARAHHDCLDLRGQLLLQVLLLRGQRSLALCRRLGLALQAGLTVAPCIGPMFCSARSGSPAAHWLPADSDRAADACSFSEWYHTQIGCTYTLLVLSCQAPWGVQLIAETASFDD